MKNSKFSLLITGVLFLFVIALGACSKDDSQPAPTNNNTNTNNPPKPSWKDTLARNWEVTKATHNGQNDNSSKGLKFAIKNDGTYNFNNGEYLGIWEFTDTTFRKILLDKNNQSIKTTWTVTTFTSKKLIVDFKSPFTQGNAHWEMEPK